MMSIIKECINAGMTHGEAGAALMGLGVSTMIPHGFTENEIREVFDGLVTGTMKQWEEVAQMRDDGDRDGLERKLEEHLGKLDQLDNKKREPSS